MREETGVERAEYYGVEWSGAESWRCKKYRSVERDFFVLRR